MKSLSPIDELKDIITREYVDDGLSGKASKTVHNVKDYGATGDGSTDDTAAVQSAVSAAIAAGGGEVFFPSGVYMVDPLECNGSNLHINGTGAASIIRMNPTDLDVLGEFWSVLEFYGTTENRLTGIVVENVTVDGNKENHTGTRLLNMECVNLKYCDRSVIRNCFIMNSPSEGVDVDYSDNVMVLNNHIEACGGNGIHNSEHNQRMVVIGNYVYGCGNTHNRSGIDQYNNASNGLYVGNYCIGNYRNYNIHGSGATCVANKSIASGTTAADNWSGSTGDKVTRRFRSHDTNSRVGDVETQYGWGYIQGDGTNSFVTGSVTFPAEFDVPPVISFTLAGYKGSVPTHAGDTTNGVASNRSTTGITQGVSTTGFNFCINSASTISASYYWVYHWTAIGPVAAD